MNSNNKKAKAKTTLDKKHKDKVSSFENIANEKNKILNKIDSNNKKLEKINKLDYSQYSQNIINEKATLLDENKTLTDKLECLSSHTDELLYYNNTIDYISSYYEQNNKQSDIKQMEILDFFNNSNIVNKKNTLYNKAEILENYLKATDNKQIKIGKYKKFKPKFCPSIECGAEMTLHLSDGYLICTECGFCEEIILDSDKPNYKEPVPDATAYSYKRINHFNELTSWSNNIIVTLVC